MELRKKLRRLYPNIFATKYRMDINEDGFWDGSKSEEQSREQPKTKTHRNRPKAAIARQKNKETSKKEKLAVNTSYGTAEGKKPSIKPPSTTSESVSQPDQNIKPRLVSPTPANHVDLTKSANRNNNLALASMIQNQMRVMSTRTGLPLTDDHFQGIAFTEEGLETLQDSAWVGEEVVDPFSAMELQDSSDVYYLSTNHYTHYYNHLASGDENPVLISERRIFQPEERRRKMRSKKMWIATICENGHWQVLCIVNPGKEHCVAFLLDSLVSSVNQRPANFDKCQAYATAFVNQVYQDDNLSNQQALPLRIGLVPKQPNFTDCGVFAVLNVQHAAMRVNDFVSFGTVPEWNVFLDWYTVQYGVQHRRTLREQYEHLLNTCSG